MEYQLDGYLNPASPKYGFPGYQLEKVTWSANIGDYEASQEEGRGKIAAAISKAFAAGQPGDDVVVVGYSSSANVIIREIRRLDAKGSPHRADLSFIVLGSPNRPNGGIYNRFPDLVSALGFTYDGPNPDTDYPLMDVSWEYDPISDFPTYPLNLLATANSGMAFLYQHTNYYEADLDDAVDNPNMTYTTHGGTKYVTVGTKRLPLLRPLYDAGFPTPALDLVEPTLKVWVDYGYDRSIPVGQLQSAKVSPSLEATLALGPALAKAAEQGIRNAVAGTQAGATPAGMTGTIGVARSTQTTVAGAEEPEGDAGSARPGAGAQNGTRRSGVSAEASANTADDPQRPTGPAIARRESREAVPGTKQVGAVDTSSPAAISPVSRATVEDDSEPPKAPPKAPSTAPEAPRGAKAPAAPKAPVSSPAGDSPGAPTRTRTSRSDDAPEVKDAA